MSKLHIWPVAAVFVLFGGCAKEVPVATSKPFCRAMKNVCISNDDVLTERTASQIEANNLGHKRLCGTPPPCKG